MAKALSYFEKPARSRSLLIRAAVISAFAAVLVFGVLGIDFLIKAADEFNEAQDREKLFLSVEADGKIISSSTDQFVATGIPAGLSSQLGVSQMDGDYSISSLIDSRGGRWLVLLSLYDQGYRYQAVSVPSPFSAAVGIKESVTSGSISSPFLLLERSAKGQTALETPSEKSLASTVRLRDREISIDTTGKLLVSDIE